MLHRKTHLGPQPVVVYGRMATRFCASLLRAWPRSAGMNHHFDPDHKTCPCTLDHHCSCTCPFTTTIMPVYQSLSCRSYNPYADLPELFTQAPNPVCASNPARLLGAQNLSELIDRSYGVLQSYRCIRAHMDHLQRYSFRFWQTAEDIIPAGHLQPTVKTDWE
jgi:hypothetical protein